MRSCFVACSVLLLALVAQLDHCAAQTGGTPLVGFEEGLAARRRGIVSIGLLTRAADLNDGHSPVTVFNRRCLGSVIRTRYPMMLLTAAHCVYYKTIGYSWAGRDQYYAAVDYMDDSDLSQAVFGKVLDLRIPDVYTSDQRRFYGDIAVISLDLHGDINRDNTLDIFFTIPSPSIWDETVKDLSYDDLPGHSEMNLAVYGWTKTGELMATVMRPLKAQFCRQWYIETLNISASDSSADVETGWSKAYIRGDEVCAVDMDSSQGQLSGLDLVFGDTNDDHYLYEFGLVSCQGDSGGAMVSEHPFGTDPTNPQIRYIYAVTSSGLAKADCDPKFPAIFASVDFYRKWIIGAQACLILEHSNRLDSDIDGSVAANNERSDKLLSMTFQTEATENIRYYKKFKKAYRNIIEDFVSNSKKSGWRTELNRRCDGMAMENQRMMKPFQ